MLLRRLRVLGRIHFYVSESEALRGLRPIELNQLAIGDIRWLGPIPSWDGIIVCRNYLQRKSCVCSPVITLDHGVAELNLSAY